jgi:hypothetical protein
MRVLAWAGILVVAGVCTAAAQFLPMPGQSTPNAAFPPAPGQTGPSQAASGPPSAPSSAFPPPPSQQQAICKSFVPLRDETQKSAEAIKAAGDRKAPREEVCGLFKAFAAKEAKLVKFLVDHKSTCGVPPKAIAAARSNHAKTLEIRKNVCSAGPAPGGPSLSDALGGPIIADDTSAKPGRGTFDTLTGNVLSR